MVTSSAARGAATALGLRERRDVRLHAFQMRFGMQGLQPLPRSPRRASAARRPSAGSGPASIAGSKRASRLLGVDTPIMLERPGAEAARRRSPAPPPCPIAASSPTIGKNTPRCTPTSAPTAPPMTRPGLRRANDVGGLQHVGRVQAGHVGALAGDEVDVLLGDARQQQVIHRPPGAGQVGQQPIDASAHVRPPSQDLQGPTRRLLHRREERDSARDIHLNPRRIKRRDPADGVGRAATATAQPRRNVRLILHNRRRCRTPRASCSTARRESRAVPHAAPWPLCSRSWWRLSRPCSRPPPRTPALRSSRSHRSRPHKPRTTSSSANSRRCRSRCPMNGPTRGRASTAWCATAPSSIARPAPSRTSCSRSASNGSAATSRCS